MAIDDGGPAFPGPAQCEQTDDIHEGMSLRDWFAGMALQGFLADFKFDHARGRTAELCYDLADVMIEERKKRNE